VDGRLGDLSRNEDLSRYILRMVTTLTWHMQRLS
jgi:hypothetical protein